MNDTKIHDESATDIYNVEEQIGYLLRRAHQRASSLFQAQFSEFQITPTQFSALAKLRDETELSQNHLGRLTAMDPATIQGVTRRLIDRDLVQTRADVNDKRRMLLCLTDKGIEFIDSLIPKARLVTENTVAPLDEEEKRQIVALLRKLA